jgi:UDP-N-acetylmuramoyl-tripeptide--D-alanyl-D-alanine ligase
VKRILSYFALRYLRFFAKAHLLKIKLIQKIKGKKLIIVGITGSAGKTSCLLACQAALGPQFKIKTNSHGNSETGIPLSILDLKMNNYSPFGWLKIFILCPIQFIFNWKTYQIFLVEMGIDSQYSPKNMDYLLSIIKPDIGIFLNVSSVHQQNFNSLDQIAFEKAKMINLSPIGIVNLNDPLVKKYSHPKKLINISKIKINIPKFALPHAYQDTLSAAIDLSKLIGLTESETITNLQKYLCLPESRSSLLDGIKNSVIIDSSYNSSPLACIEMLTLLHSFPSPHLVVLGDMRELGDSTIIEHQKIYRQALKSADKIISVGPLTQKYFGPKAQKFLYWWQAADYLKQNLPPQSTILIKGSQNTIFLEELIKTILKNPSDSSKLCRQSPHWLKLKEKFRQSAIV